jgi:lipid-A-disaccharide synthase
MHVFISAGEPSGDLHGASLARAVQQLSPGVTLTGFGGERMRAAGCDLIYPLAEHPIMYLGGAVRALPLLLRLRARMTADFKKRRPDAVVLIDYPGFHWHLAKRARSLGIPVVYFVAPQIWAWFSHRVRKVRANFAEVLCTLPFEEAWYRERGVAAKYVGHPYFDELAAQQLDTAFIAGQHRRGGPIVAILPGSRQAEIDRNLELLVGAMRIVHADRPDARFLVAAYRSKHAEHIDARLRHAALPAEVFTGRTPEVIALADACVAVSGSVSLELLHRGVPSAIVYRIGEAYVKLSKLFLNVPHICLVNLIAGRVVFPEYLTSTSDPRGPAADVLRWLNDPSAAGALRAELGQLCAEVGRPGACERAARAVVELVTRRAAA